nr:hypothetical protein [uncultured Draconibacterium sp.]
MGIFGAIIKTIKGVKKSKELNKSIEKLEDIDNSKVLDLTENITFSKYYLAKLRLLELKEENARRDKLSKQELKIIELMNEHIIENRERLLSKKATQLDVANLILSVHKLQHETADNFHSLASESIKSIEASEELQKEYEKVVMLEQSNKQELNKTSAELKALETRAKSAINDLSSNIKNQICNLENSLDDKINHIKKENQQLKHDFATLSDRIDKSHASLLQTINKFNSDIQESIKQTEIQTNHSFNILKNENRKTKRLLILSICALIIFAIYSVTLT